MGMLPEGWETLQVSGPNDGTIDAYGVGDFWVLRYYPGELGDGVRELAPIRPETMAHIDKFAENREPVRDKNVVI
jgi:hypothetical protein